jgi:hypothetical protein
MISYLQIRNQVTSSSSSCFVTRPWLDRPLPEARAPARSLPAHSSLPPWPARASRGAGPSSPWRRRPGQKRAAARARGAAAGPGRSSLTKGRADQCPDYGQFVDAVGDRVVLERDLAEVGGQAQDGDAAVEGAVDDLQLDPGQRLAPALVHAEAERHVMAGRRAAPAGRRSW